jgi:hypothetical protein
LIVPPIWLTSLRLLPRMQTPHAAELRRPSSSAARPALLALMSVLVLSSLGTTANDPLATVPLLVGPGRDGCAGAPSDRRAAAAAALWGVSSRLQAVQRAGHPAAAGVVVAHARLALAAAPRFVASQPAR